MNIKNDDKNKKNQQNIAPEEKITIMPTMIDESEEQTVKHRDLSAIIPKYSEEPSNKDAIELISKDNILKSDGSIALATLNDEGQAILTAQAKIPNPIDIEERKKESQKNKNRGKSLKKEKKKNNKSAQRFQNNMALISFFLIAFLTGFFYWYKNHPTEEDFVPLTVTIELGESLPIRTSSYVKPGIGKEVDELLYALDLSKVVIEEVGEYEFTVTYKNMSKKGKIIIKDTTPPELEIRNLVITEGKQYDASQFVETCKDPSGCNYSFQDSDTEKKYATTGSYVVYVVATDAYQNTVTKKANLIIEAQGNVKTFVKKTNFEFQTGYETIETYDLHFAEYNTYSILITGTYEQKFIYQDIEVYQKARQTYNGEVNYTCLDNEMTIVMKKSISTVGSNYSKLGDIEPYLKKEGFNEIS